MPCTEQGLLSRWKTLNKELGKWRDAKKKVQDNYQSGTSLADEVRKCFLVFYSNTFFFVKIVRIIFHISFSLFKHKGGTIKLLKKLKLGYAFPTW